METIVVKITRLTVRHWNLLLGFAVVLIALLFSGVTDARKPQLRDTSITRGRTAGGYPYMNGGMVFDEQQAMERLSAVYNLKLVFARRSDTFLSPVLLIIATNDGRQIDKILLRGPWFYVRLPSGGYTILARFKSKAVLIRDVYLREGRRKTYFVRGN